MPNYRPEVASFFDRLRQKAIMPVAIYNEDTQEWDEVDYTDAVDEVVAVDMAYVRVSMRIFNWYGETQRIEKAILLFVLGNDPGEVVADYMINPESTIAKVLDMCTKEHYDEWSNR